MASDFRRGDNVSVPCRGCGRTSHRLKIDEGSHDFKCASCGRVTRIRVRCSADVCRIFTELAGPSQPG